MFRTLLICITFCIIGLNCKPYNPALYANRSIEIINLYSFVSNSFYEYITDTEDEEEVTFIEEEEDDDSLMADLQRFFGSHTKPEKPKKPQKLRKDMLAFMGNSFLNFIKGSEDNDDDDDEHIALTFFKSIFLGSKKTKHDEEEDLFSFVCRTFYEYITDTEGKKQNTDNRIQN